LQLTAARERALTHGIENGHAKMNVFVKVETSTSATDPRNISPRSDEFFSILGPFVSAIEHAAHACEYLVKGLTPNQRGAIISEEWRGEVIETDFSRFDMTVSKDIVQSVELDMFRKAYPLGAYPELDAILPLLGVMSGNSRNGNSYRIDGTRASGDAHTSIANGCINRFVIWASLRKLPETSWSSFHEGDDGFINCDADIKTKVSSLLGLAGLLGFKLKVILPDSHVFAKFCGRHICDGCHNEFCDLPRTLAKLHITIKNGELKPLALAKALSYLSTDPQTPIIGRICRSLVTHLKPMVTDSQLHNRINRSFRKHEANRVKMGVVFDSNSTPFDPLPCCRASVALVTGWSIDMQIAIEKQYESWSTVIWEVPPIQVSDHLVDSSSYSIY
jgi:hypothetical protein